jgi:hypothetical protein
MLRAVAAFALMFGLAACGDDPAAPLQSAAASLPAPPAPFATPWLPRAGEDFIIPANSLVKLVRVEPVAGVVHFAGDFELTGTWELGYWNEESRSMELAPADLALRFIPDAATQARLPHWKAWTRNRDVDFDDALATLRRLAGQKLVDDLLAHRIASVRGAATLRVRDFDTWIECDSAHFGVKFVDVQRVARPASGSQEYVSDADTGC